MMEKFRMWLISVTGFARHINERRPTGRLKCTVALLVALSEPPKSAKARRSPQAMASPCQGLQRSIGAFGGLPSGEPLAGHLRCCVLLKGNDPSGEDAPCS